MSKPAAEDHDDEHAAFNKWKESMKGEDGKLVKQGKPRVKTVWLKDSVGKLVDVHCRRSPMVHGTVRAIDVRFGKVLLENDDETIEVSMSDIAQVRYPKP